IMFTPKYGGKKVNRIIKVKKTHRAFAFFMCLYLSFCMIFTASAFSESLKRWAIMVLSILLFLTLGANSMNSAIASENYAMKTQERIPETPRRIIVLPLFAEEILLEMIGPERIVGVWHEYTEGAEVYTPTMEMTKYMEHWIEIDDTERIIDLKPDLVITWNSTYSSYETIIPTLEQAGINVLLIDTPDNFEEVKASITMLGSIVDAQDEAVEMVKDIDAKLAWLAKTVASVPNNERVRVTDYRSYAPLKVYNGALSEAAGVISDGGAIFVERTYYQEIDDLLLIQWNPDLITIRPYITDTDGSLYEFGEDYVGRFISSLIKNPGLAKISAIQKRNVQALCVYHSQYMVQSAIDLAKFAYPHLFGGQGE
nr:ABC transporter substrate-binding protein [Clostridia bacterium]